MSGVVLRITVGDLLTGVLFVFLALFMTWAALDNWWQNRKRRRGGK